MSVLDRFTDVDELSEEILLQLEENNRLTRSILEQFGAIDRESPDDTVTSPYQYIGLNNFEEPFALPGGYTKFDFDEGKVTHSGIHTDYDSSSERFDFPDAGELSIDIRDFDEIMKGIVGKNLSGLRSLIIRPDIPISVKLGKSGEFVQLDPAIFSSIKSHGFTEFTLRSIVSFEFTGMISTQTDAFNITGARADMSRYGSEASVSDSWSAVEVRAPRLANHNGAIAGNSPLIDTGTSLTNFTHYVIPTNAYDEVTITVKNRSVSNGQIDARIQYSDTGSFQWFKTGDSVTEDTGSGIGIDDHYIFHITEEHRYLRVQLENVTAGDANEADVFLEAGGG